MPKYMNKDWLERQIEEVNSDNNELVFFDKFNAAVTYVCLDSLQACYRDEDNMDN
jgi:hypothetical protein